MVLHHDLPDHVVQLGACGHNMDVLTTYKFKPGKSKVYS